VSREHRSSRRRAYGRRQHEIGEDHAGPGLWRLDAGPFRTLSASLDAAAAPELIDGAEALPRVRALPSLPPVCIPADAGRSARNEWPS
jgi:hypothetical protein